MLPGRCLEQRQRLFELGLRPRLLMKRPSLCLGLWSATPRCHTTVRWRRHACPLQTRANLGLRGLRGLLRVPKIHCRIYTPNLKSTRTGARPMTHLMVRAYFKPVKMRVWVASPFGSKEPLDISSSLRCAALHVELYLHIPSTLASHYITRVYENRTFESIAVTTTRADPSRLHAYSIRI